MEKSKRNIGKGNAARGARMLDYLGYCFMPEGYVIMRKCIKQNFARKAKSKE